MRSPIITGLLRPVLIHQWVKTHFKNWGGGNLIHELKLVAIHLLKSEPGFVFFGGLLILWPKSGFKKPVNRHFFINFAFYEIRSELSVMI
jgi:hypothetical protein